MGFTAAPRIKKDLLPYSDISPFLGLYPLILAQEIHKFSFPSFPWKRKSSFINALRISSITNGAGMHYFFDPVNRWKKNFMEMEFFS